MRPHRRRSPLPILLLATLLVSCRTRDIAELAREHQFEIGLGRLENQIDLFQIRGRLPAPGASLFMRDGTFYISNRSGSKVMGFSSYGDLLLLLYDPAVNPDPVGLSIVGDATGIASTKRAARHTLTEIGRIAVDSRETLYLEAISSRTLAVSDPAMGVKRQTIILRFDREGRALPYLGMDGVGGTPFPPVTDLILTARDDLVVISRTSADRRVSWFAPDGSPRFQAVLSEAQIPLAAAASTARVIQGIRPDANGPYLYVLVEYLRESRDRATGTATAVEPATSVLHRLNLQTSRFDRSVELPSIRSRSVRSAGREAEIPGSRYVLLGVVEQGYAILLRHEAQGVYELAALGPAGKLQERRRLYVDEEGLTSLSFHLSTRGILSALLADSMRARVVWWRSDRILGPGLP